MTRIPTLDGWRGIAILLVMVDHLARNGPFADQSWAQLGFFGVDIFFVLSGYIITVRLLEEQRSSSTIHLARFYQRRIFRILPVVVVYVAALGALSVFRDCDLSISQVAASLFFYRNYQIAGNVAGISTAHFWSLSIEEHFYLLWPLLLLRSGQRRALWIALTGALACALWRIYDCAHPNGIVGRLLPGSDPGLRILRTDLRLDGLLIGCALAILMSRPGVRSFILRNFPKETPLVCGALVFFEMHWNPGMPTLTKYLLVAVAVASTLVVEEGLAYKWLNARLLVWIGTISFSIYVWQQIFLFNIAILHPLGILNFFPWSAICALAAAACSYYFLEKPMQRLGRRLMRDRNPVIPPVLVSVSGEPS
jgi:peptidoglycan/LPS O-acetylase OafA/YrhL